MKTVFRQFPAEGEPVSFEQIRSGHINDTYLVATDAGVRYILQRVNRYVFPNVDAIMNNASRIAAFLQKEGGGEVNVIRYMDTRDGRRCFDDGAGGTWRMYRFVENSVCHRYAENDGQLYESGRGFGAFLHALRGFPVGELEESIAGFHDTPARYAAFRRAVRDDIRGRRSETEREIRFILEREERACRLQRMREKGELPVRVTHNDTKINNILMDGNSGRAVCVIDLDTVMPGLSACDFGDAIRYGASTAVEGERDPDRVRFDPDRFRAFTRGFLEACPSLTEKEIAALPLGAYAMTLECGLRFLTDYLSGDRYFPANYEAQNLDRCRTQLHLAEQMETQFDEMARIVEEERTAAHSSG